VPTGETTGGPLLRCIAIVVAALAIGHTLYSAWNEDWTIDEPLHLAWSRRYWDSGVGERVSQTRYMSKTPATLPHVLAMRAAARLGVKSRSGLRFAARLPSVACVPALLLGTFLLARILCGTGAALVALIGVALDPSIVAHGSLVTVDAPYAVATLLVLGSALRFAREPSKSRALLVGGALGLALLVKFTAMFLLPGLLFLPLAKPRDRGPRFLAACVALAALGAGFVVCCGYLFHEVAAPLGSVTWRSGAMLRLATLLPRLRIPLPTVFLTGLDVSLANERQPWNALILGKRYPQGVWFYFALLWLVKTPLLLLVAELRGLVAAAWRRLPLVQPGLRFVGANLLLQAAYFSLAFHTQLGYRFVLMLIPLGWILAAAGLASLKASRANRALGVAAVVLALGENVFYAGNPLAFTNAAIWPKREVFRLIADSNVDWGQNREKIGSWLDAASIPESRLDPLHMLPGSNVFGLNTVAGTFNFEQHRWLREHAEPRGHFGHTYLWFEVDDALYDRFLDEARHLESHDAARSVCGPDLAYAPLRRGAWLPFKTVGDPEPGHAWVACVSAPDGADFGMRAMSGRVFMGPYGADGRCHFELLDDDQLSWYRLDPGTHAFCAQAMRNRRPWLPNEFRGRWLLRRSPARVNVRFLALPTPEPAAPDDRPEEPDASAR